MTIPQIGSEASQRLRTEKRLNITKDTDLDYVISNGSTGQKLMAPLFNFNGGGYTDEEIADFNRYTFKVEENKITMYKKRDDGTKQITEVKFDNIEDFKKCIDKKGSFYNIAGNHKALGEIIINADYDKAVVDLRNNTAVIEGARGESIKAGSNYKLELNNSYVKEITMYSGSLNLKNTRGDKGIVFDSKTEVILLNDAKVTMDSKTKANVVEKK